MQRQLALALVTIVGVACADGVSPTDAPGESLTSLSVGDSRSASPMDIAIIGDVPYGQAALAQFPALIEAINADPKVRLAVHVGDIKAGDTVCSDAWFNTIATDFSTFHDPLVYAIGDNEWTDCHRANNGGYLPVERLAKLREIFFPTPGRTLGGRNMRVDAQQDYPENQLWVDSRVTFAALHIVGSNNGRQPWFGAAETPEQRAVREAEVEQRIAANLEWLERTFRTAREEQSVGVLLVFQADLFNPFDRALGTVSFSGHTAFVQRLAELAEAFGRPVLLVAGDSHDFRVDAGVPWFALYGASPLPNVTSIIVDRSLEADANWLRVRIDPRSQQVFTWEEVTVSFP